MAGAFAGAHGSETAEVARPTSLTADHVRDDLSRELSAGEAKASKSRTSKRQDLLLFGLAYLLSLANETSG